MDPVVDVTARASLALLFLSATAHKLRDVARFRATVADYRLLPRPLVSLGAILLVVAEGAVVCALVVARWWGPISGTKGVFALLAYDPRVRRVYQPAALPERVALERAPVSR
jgi:Methylamine utilisation protein MauE